MKHFTAFLLTCLFASASFAASVNVAAAISLKDALVKLGEQYKAATGVEVEFSIGSSGQLAAQIQNGAPVDLFISAANKQVDDLVKSEVADGRSRREIAGNTLVIIVPSGSDISAKSLKDFKEAGVTKIAIGEPKAVPAGQYAMQALKSAGVDEAVKEKLIFGTNVRQVLDYVQRGEVSAGVVYATDALIAGEKVRVAATVDPASHEPVVYPAVVVKASKQPAEAKRFLDFLLQEKGQATLKEFGFSPPPAPATRPAARPAKAP